MKSPLWGFKWTGWVIQKSLWQKIAVVSQPLGKDVQPASVFEGIAYGSAYMNADNSTRKHRIRIVEL
jgi:hypothetical protein